jgi:hypothetical protein
MVSKIQDSNAPLLGIDLLIALRIILALDTNSVPLDCRRDLLHETLDEFFVPVFQLALSSLIIPPLSADNCTTKTMNTRMKTHFPTNVTVLVAFPHLG